MNKLAIRHRLFAKAYLAADLNATKAAISAGYSEKTAYSQGQRLMKNVEVKALIAELAAEKFKQLDISADRILQELARLAFLEPRKLFREDGSLIPIKELDDNTAAAIAGIEHDKLFEHFGKGQAKHVGTTSKIKLWDKTRALEMLGRYRKLFTDRVEVSGLEGLADRVNKIRQRKHGNASN